MAADTGFSAYMHGFDLQMPLLDGAKCVFHVGARSLL